MISKTDISYDMLISCISSLKKAREINDMATIKKIAQFVRQFMCIDEPDFNELGQYASEDKNEDASYDELNYVELKNFLLQ